MAVTTILTNSQKPIKDWGSSYYDVNIVFKNHDPFFNTILKHHTDLWVRIPVITDIEKWDEIQRLAHYELGEDGDYHRVNNCDYDEESLRIHGYVLGPNLLEYIEKFDVYRCWIAIPKNSATDGILKYLDELHQIKNLNADQFYDLLNTLSSLNNFS
jgi:hypothetical protein